MSRYYGRLLFALFLSLTGFITTQWLFGGSGYVSRSANEAPIAKLDTSVNEVQRKPIGKLVWESVTQGEELFAGEDIRTSQASSAKIYLFEAQATVALEPDSLIRLEKNSSGLALNFLAGNLLVSGSGTGTGPSVTVKTGNQAIALNNADLSLSKTASGQVDLEVLKGKATLASGGKSLQLDESTAGTLSTDGLTEDKNRLKLLTPLIGEPVLVDASEGSRVTFSWQKLSSGYEVYLERGTDRQKLARLPNSRTPGEVGELSASMKPGRWYFKVVALPTQEGLTQLATNTLPLEVTPKLPPVLVQPTQDKMVLNLQDPQLTFKWATRISFDSFIMEVAANANLTEDVQKIEINKDAREHTLSWPKSGRFYWRLSGFLKNQGKMVAVASKVQPFDVQVGVKLTPPNLKSPLPQQRLAHAQVVERGVLFSWDNQAGITSYRLQVDTVNGGAEPLVKDITTNPYRIRSLKPGQYSWAMASLDEEGTASAFSEKRTFTIDELPRIEWADGEIKGEELYVTAEPMMNLKWKVLNQEVSSYRVRWALEGQLKGDTPWQKSNQNEASAQLSQNGVYVAEVEALNQEDQVIARSALRTIRVQPRPLLPAPEYASDLPAELKADRRGGVEFSWNEIQGAKEYQVILKNDRGETKVTKVERNIASLKGMRPGKYEISVRAVDAHARPGQPSESKPLEVPNLSDIKAPKIKQLKIK